MRSELAALQKARADEDARGSEESPEKSKAETKPATDEDSKDQPFELEQTFKELAEASEKEIAENPLIATGLAFLLGFIAGRVSRA